MIEMTSLSGGRRWLVLFVTLGLFVMLGSSLWMCLNGNPLLVHNESAVSQVAPGATGMGMDPNIARLMQQLRDEPENVAALMELTDRLLLAENWAAAEVFARRAQAAAPSAARPWYLIGVILHNLGKHGEAAAALERAVALQDDPSARYSLAVLYSYYLQEREKGIAQLRAGLALPDVAETLRAAMRDELAKLEARETGDAAGAK